MLAELTLCCRVKLILHNLCMQLVSLSVTGMAGNDGDPADPDAKDNVMYN